MDVREIRSFSGDEVRVKLDEAHETLFNLRFQRVVGQLENTARLREVRQDIARMKTVLRERELSTEGEV